MHVLIQLPDGAYLLDSITLLTITFFRCPHVTFEVQSVRRYFIKKLKILQELFFAG